MTSFYCFAPVEDPKYSVYVVLDEPAAGASGSTSAAPTAISLIKQALNYNTADTTLGGAVTEEIQVPSRFLIWWDKTSILPPVFSMKRDKIRR